MIAREVNMLLTKAALIDPRMKRVDKVEQADMAEEWAATLAGVDVTLEQALDAVRKHYLAETRTVMPSDIVAAVGATPEVEQWTHVRDLDQEDLVERRRIVRGRVPAALWAAHGHDDAWVVEQMDGAAPRELVAYDENGEAET